MSKSDYDMDESDESEVPFMENVTFEGPYDAAFDRPGIGSWTFSVSGSDYTFPEGSIKCESVTVERHWKWPRMFRWLERLFCKEEYQVAYTFVTVPVETKDE